MVLINFTTWKYIAKVCIEGRDCPSKSELGVRDVERKENLGVAATALSGATP